jgi:hypothetical protein
MDAYTVDLYQLRWSTGTWKLRLKCRDRWHKDYVLSGGPALRPSRATVLQMATKKKFETSEGHDSGVASAGFAVQLTPAISPMSTIKGNLGVGTTIRMPNIINIEADIGAMQDAVNLLVGGPTFLYCVLFALVSIPQEVFIPVQNDAIGWRPSCGSRTGLSSKSNGTGGLPCMSYAMREGLMIGYSVHVIGQREPGMSHGYENPQKKKLRRERGRSVRG